MDSSCGGSLQDNSFTTDKIFFNCSVEARFGPIPSFTVTSSSGENGRIDPEGQSVVRQGSSTVFNLIPNDEFRTASVSGSCGGTLEGDFFKTNPIKTDCTVVAGFEPVPATYYPVTVMANPGGSVDPESPLQVAESEFATFNLSPDENHEVKSIEGQCVESFEDGLLTTKAIFSACDIQVLFGLIPGSVPPEPPILSVSNITNNTALLNIEPQTAGSDPIARFDVACEIDDAAFAKAPGPRNDDLIGDVVLSAGTSGNLQGKGFITGNYDFAANAGVRTKQVGKSLLFPAMFGSTASIEIEKTFTTQFGNTILQGSEAGKYFHLLITPRGQMLGHYFDGTSSFEIRPNGSSHSIAVGAEGGVIEALDVPVKVADSLASYGLKEPFDAETHGYISEDFSVISSLILVDQAIVDEQASSAVADYFISVANATLLKSGVNVALTVAGIEKYSPNAESFTTALNDIRCGKTSCRSSDPPNSIITSLRDRHQADLVIQMLWQGIEQFCGIAYVPTSTSREYLKSNTTYSVNAVGSADLSRLCSSDVVAHEIGHNMGLSHNVEQYEDVPETLVTGGRGYLLPNDLYGRGSVMAYGRSLYRFSDPSVSVSGMSLGRTLEPHPANAVSALNTVRDKFSAIYDDSNDNLIPETPRIRGIEQNGRNIEITFDAVSAPMGTPVNGVTSGTRILGYAATCGDITEINTISPVILRNFETNQTYECELVAITPYAASSPTQPTQIFMSPLEVTVSPSSSGNGAISPDEAVKIIEGESVSFSLTPDESYRVAGVSGTCGGTLVGVTYTTDRLTENCSVEAHFEALPRYIVAPTSSEGGIITPSGKQTVLEAKTVSFLMQPQEGYFLKSVGGTCQGTLENSTYLVGPVTENCSVISEFEAIPVNRFPVVVTTVGEGSVSPSALGDLEEGSVFELEALPENGWQLKNFSGSCGGSSDGNSYRSAPVTEACEVTVTFEPIQWLVSISSGANGAVEPSQSVRVQNNNALTLEISPDEGFKIGELQNSCGGQLVGFDLTTNPITADCSVEVSFEALPPITYQVTGNISGNGYFSIDLPLQVVEGELLSFRVTALSNNRLVSISGCGGEMSGDIFNTAEIRSNCRVDAKFEQYRWDYSGLSNEIAFNAMPEETPFTCIASAYSAAGESDDVSTLRFTTLSHSDLDTDEDGVPDVSDNCPLITNGEQLDFDLDGSGDRCDLDDDNDGVIDSEDALPLDPSESIDTDGDGVGDNADYDDDNDGVSDISDAFPLDAGETLDTDGDGVGNNADDDDDGDGVSDQNDAFPLDPEESIDTDSDGIGDNEDLDKDGDGFPDLDELLAGTDPLDANSYPEIPEDETGGMPIWMYYIVTQSEASGKSAP